MNRAQRSAAATLVQDTRWYDDFGSSERKIYYDLIHLSIPICNFTFSSSGKQIGEANFVSLRERERESIVRILEKYEYHRCSTKSAGIASSASTVYTFEYSKHKTLENREKFARASSIFHKTCKGVPHFVRNYLNIASMEATSHASLLLYSERLTVKS